MIDIEVQISVEVNLVTVETTFIVDHTYISTFECKFGRYIVFLLDSKQDVYTDTYITVNTMKWDGDNSCYGIETV